MAVIKSLSSMPVAKQGGKLVRIPIGRPGSFVLMDEDEARAKGLLPPLPEPAKAKKPARNKMRKVAENKAE